MTHKQKNKLYRQYIRVFMDKYGASMAFMGRIIGVSGEMISMFLKNERTLSPEKLDELHKFFKERNFKTEFEKTKRVEKEKQVVCEF